ncbi:MAG: aryl-sulfate sulfohydrolase, partial [Rubripirellula sp.]
SFPSGVIRDGDWKLIENFETGELQLFNLATDIGESQNVAQQNAELTANLLAKLKRWRSSVNADPMLENPQYQLKNKKTQ